MDVTADVPLRSIMQPNIQDGGDVGRVSRGRRLDYFDGCNVLGSKLTEIATVSFAVVHHHHDLVATLDRYVAHQVDVNARHHAQHFNARWNGIGQVFAHVIHRRSTSPRCPPALPAHDHLIVCAHRRHERYLPEVNATGIPK